ncbi:MAG: molybdopterin molybdotransferase MoeA [Acidiferrobacterales bacterium]|nr:molybdopterin molybdotransferase MoeA [Acidiferrobacterales bacterium]
MSKSAANTQDISCDFDPGSISADEALRRILADITPIHQTESISLRTALGRVTAIDVKSRVNVPNHTNSAMDGYALKGDALPSEDTATFKVAGISFAGKPFRGGVRSGECIRIMTGAVMPEGCDTVVTQERVSREGDSVTISEGESAGANVRQAGEDLAPGDVAIAAGTRIGPAHLGLAASLGFSELPVLRRPRVAFFSTGDELRSVGEVLETGDLYDSNRYTLFGMLSEDNVELVDLGIVRDDPNAIRQGFEDAADCADVVITSAGASVGDADYVKQTLDAIGAVNFWKVAIKPGRPLSFGNVKGSLFFGLPGNPVSVMVTYQIFVREAIRRLSGERDAPVLKLQVPLASNLRKRPGRVEYQRGVLSKDDAGNTVVSSTGEQGSGILHSMSVANCFIILPAESDGAQPGELVQVQPFSQFT